MEDQRQGKGRAGPHFKTGSSYSDPWIAGIVIKGSHPLDELNDGGSPAATFHVGDLVALLDALGDSKRSSWAMTGVRQLRGRLRSCGPTGYVPLLL